MTENEIYALIVSWENMPLVLRHISDSPENLDRLMSIALNDQLDKSWRAMYLAEIIHEKNPKLIRPFLPAMTDFLLTTKNSSKKRHILKLISLNDIPEEKMAVLLNYCIDIFISAEPVAVRVHAMQILYNIAQKETDFAGELISLIETEIEFHGSAGIASRGRKLLKKLYMMRS